MGDRAAIFSLIYSNCIRQLTSDLIAQTDLFVLELFRQYPGGLRAEGVALAEKLARRGKRSLIVSPLFLAQHLRCDCYWDVASKDSLAARVARVGTSARPLSTEIKILLDFFAPHLAIPPQHDR